MRGGNFCHLLFTNDTGIISVVVVAAAALYTHARLRRHWAAAKERERLADGNSRVIIIMM